MDSLFSFFKDAFSTDKFFEISGEATFQVDVAIQGDPPYTSSTFSVQAFNDLKSRIAIAVKYKWYRIYGSSKELIKTSGSTYHVSAADAGTQIMVEITPVEEDENGTAIVTFGQVSLDPVSKKAVQGIIRSNGTCFNIDAISMDEEELSNIQTTPDSKVLISRRSFKIFSNKREMTIGFDEQFELHPSHNPRVIGIQINNRVEDTGWVCTNSCSNKGSQIFLLLPSVKIRDLLILTIQYFERLNCIEDSTVLSSRLRNSVGENLEKLDLLQENVVLSKEIQYLCSSNAALTLENQSLLMAKSKLNSNLTPAMREGDLLDLSSSKIDDANKDLKAKVNILNSSLLKRDEEIITLQEQISKLKKTIDSLSFRELNESRLSTNERELRLDNEIKEYEANHFDKDYNPQLQNESFGDIDISMISDFRNDRRVSTKQLNDNSPYHRARSANNNLETENDLLRNENSLLREQMQKYMENPDAYNIPGMISKLASENEDLRRTLSIELKRSSDLEAKYNVLVAKSASDYQANKLLKYESKIEDLEMAIAAFRKTNYKLAAELSKSIQNHQFDEAN